MRLPGIGQLTKQGDYWRLVYTQCGHSLELTRAGLEDLRQVVPYIRSGLAECLSCQTAAAQTADGRRRDFLQLLERSSSADPPARFGERAGSTRQRRPRRP